MVRLIGLGGQPATGKSTVVRHLLKHLFSYTEHEYGTLDFRYYNTEGVIILGGYEGADFDGTDQLSMSVITDAKEFITDLDATAEHDDTIVLFEGDRLFNGSFIDFTDDVLGEAAVFYLLTVPEAELDRRHAARNDDQSDSWLTGRQTKYANLADEYDLRERSNASADDREALVNELLSELALAGAQSGR